VEPSYPGIENVELVNGQNRTTSVTEDSMLTLTCTSPYGVPAAVVTWRKKDESNTLARSKNTATYTLTASRDQDLKIYTCESSSPAFISNLSTDILLYLTCKYIFLNELLSTRIYYHILKLCHWIVRLFRSLT